MTPPLLAAHNLSVSRGGQPVVRDVSLAFHPGERVVFLGPNGAGKSSLLDALAGVVAPSGGTVTLQGRSLHALAPQTRARSVASLGQNEPADQDLVALEVALMGLVPQTGMWALPGASEVAQARAALAQLGVESVAHRRMGTLSGGERQRVLLARTLVRPVPVLLLDEPTQALDVAHVSSLMPLLRQRSEAGVLVVLVLHDLQVAARWADQVVLMRDSRVVAAGACKQVLTDPLLRSAYGVGVRVRELDGQPVVLSD